MNVILFQNNAVARFTFDFSQTVICRKNDLQTTSYIMPKSQTNMEVIPPSSHPTLLSSLNAVITNSRKIPNDPKSLDNETLTTLYRIHEINKKKIETKDSNLISENACKPLGNLDQSDCGSVKIENLSDRLCCNEVVLQRINEATLSSNAQYQNKLDDNTEDEGTSNNIENKLMGSEEFGSDLYEFASQQTLAETNKILCSQNDSCVESQSILRNSPENVASKKHVKHGTVNLAPTSILYEDNLLKQLLDEKSNIIKSYNNRKSKYQQLENQDGIIAKTYIKK